MGAGQSLDRAFSGARCLPEDADYWNRRLDALAGNRGLWAEFKRRLKDLDDSSFNILSQYAAASGRQSILHLAVLDDQLDCVSKLSSNRALLLRRNQFGLTALELAIYLHKQKSASILKGSAVCPNFFSQPNVEFEQSPHNTGFLAQPVFESPQILDEVFTYTAKAKNSGAIPNDRIWMGVYFDQEIQRGIHPGVVVRWVDREIGYGVFASERILPCSFTGEYTGIIQERKPTHANDSNYCFRYTAWPVGKRQYVIDAENMGNFTRFLNHSDDPNTELVCAYWRGMPRLIFLSLKEIPENAQLTFDYGKTFWKQCSYLDKRAL